MECLFGSIEVFLVDGGQPHVLHADGIAGIQGHDNGFVAGLAVGLVLLDVGSRPGLLVTSASMAVTGLASGIYSTANAAATGSIS